MDYEYYKTTLERAGVRFEPGLSSSELKAIEAEYGFSFPPDLQEFLMFCLPVSNNFVDWRGGSKADIQTRMNWPFEGMCFDIENNAFWLEEWGERPSVLGEAFAIARQAVNDAPTLIPICSHRYIPDRPFESGNPIFSVYQTDIICYGSDVFDYLENEFAWYFGREEHALSGKLRRIEFWSSLVEWTEKH